MRCAMSSTTEPTATFSHFLLSIAGSALVHLGEVEGSDQPVDLELARQTLDLLDMLAEKTKGNLDEEEVRLLGHLRDEVRQAYTRKHKA